MSAPALQEWLQPARASDGVLAAGSHATGAGRARPAAAGAAAIARGRLGVVGQSSTGEALHEPARDPRQAGGLQGTVPWAGTALCEDGDARGRTLVAGNGPDAAPTRLWGGGSESLSGSGMLTEDGKLGIPLPPPPPPTHPPTTAKPEAGEPAGEGMRTTTCLAPPPSLCEVSGAISSSFTAAAAERGPRPLPPPPPHPTPKPQPEGQGKRDAKFWVPRSTQDRCCREPVRRRGASGGAAIAATGRRRGRTPPPPSPRASHSGRESGREAPSTLAPDADALQPAPGTGLQARRCPGLAPGVPGLPPGCPGLVPGCPELALHVVQGAQGRPPLLLPASRGASGNGGHNAAAHGHLRQAPVVRGAQQSTLFGTVGICPPQWEGGKGGAVHRGWGQRQRPRVGATVLSGDTGWWQQPRGGRPGPVLICDTPQPPPPPSSFER